jgi:malonyl-CoA O-methyltransferase
MNLSVKCLYFAAMRNPSDLDQKSIAAQFERLGKSSKNSSPNKRNIQRVDFFLREIERRMLERLSFTKLIPSTVLDVGCGRGAGVVALQQRFPNAMVFGVDLAMAMIEAPLSESKVAPSLMTGWLQRLGLKPTEIAKSLRNSSFNAVQADSGCLPIKDSSIDLLWSNLLFHWLPDAQPSVDEWFRVIRPEGLLSFTSFGVDTFKELKALGLPLMAFPDMHDVGDLLLKAGFAEPVMDQQKLVLTYENEVVLIEEVSSFGGHVQRGRSPGLRSDSRLIQTRKALNSLRGADGKISLTVEVIYGHTWCPSRKALPDGWQPLAFKAR